MQRRLQNYKQKREKHFVVSSAQMSTQKTGLANFPCEHAPRKIPKPIFSPGGSLITKQKTLALRKRRKFADF